MRIELPPESQATETLLRLRGLAHGGDALLYEAADEMSALRKDAERYRYLRNRTPRDVLQTVSDAAGCWIDCEVGESLTLLTGDDADAAIDAAMAAAPAVGAA